jgi:hypothetical protein
VAVISIAHLSDEQRMLFVTLLLNEVVAWMRTQSGTASLRALIYMDEVFGYLPPTARPPSKLPLLTLLKQARAFGVGCLLATQNPVDLDYKALSNAGTWFLGRLQSERDRLRVLDGLEGVAASSRGGFDRQRLEATLGGLGSRVFLLNNVHEDEPVVFHTRWALSYLRGPLTRAQIQTLMADKVAASAAEAATARPTLQPPSEAAGEPAPPPLPPGMSVRYRSIDRPQPAGEVLYRPALLGEAHLHYVSARKGIDEWEPVRLLAGLDQTSRRDPWPGSELLADAPSKLEAEPRPGARFAKLPRGASTAKALGRWEKGLKTHLYRSQSRTLWSCRLLKLGSEPGESESDFRVRLAQSLRERRDLELEKLRGRYAPKLARLQDRIRTAEQRVEREKSQQSQQRLQTAVSLGSTLLGALLGRKKLGVGTVSRAATTMRGVGRMGRERDDVARASEKLEDLNQRLEELEARFESDAEQLRERFSPEDLELEQKALRPRKSDISVDALTLVWMPWRVGGEDGVVEPLFD